LSARGCDRVRHVYNALCLRGGRDQELARALEEVLLELELGARGGAHVLATESATDVDLARLAADLPRHLRAKLIEIIFRLDPTILRDELGAQFDELLQLRRSA
jgi:hypothetical protein